MNLYMMMNLDMMIHVTNVFIEYDNSWLFAVFLLLAKLVLQTCPWSQYPMRKMFCIAFEPSL